MGFEDKIKKAKTLRSVGLACIVAGMGIGGYSLYKVYDNTQLLNEGPKLMQQAFECIEKEVSYDEATKVASMPQECYAKLQEYKAFNEKPETKAAVENVDFYSSDILRYSPLGLFLIGAVVNGRGKAIARKAQLEKEAAEKDDEEED
ncbi:MAG: hypothetical protein PHO02_05760 [Candidatus Nanoarchaeia archaeon]|nr:hypothetical protein [Candidatus Nanoarchaeia archaeon]